MRESDLEYWLGIVAFLILEQLEKNMASITQLAEDVVALDTAVQALVNAPKPTGLSPEDQAAIDQADATVTTLTSQVQAATPTP